jgi:hypothetical protein
MKWTKQNHKKNIYLINYMERFTAKSKKKGKTKKWNDSKGKRMKYNFLVAI